MQFVQSSFVSAPPVSLTYEQCFLYRRNIRKAFAKHQDLDTVQIPPAPNEMLILVYFSPHAMLRAARRFGFTQLGCV